MASFPLRMTVLTIPPIRPALAVQVTGNGRSLLQLALAAKGHDRVSRRVALAGSGICVTVRASASGDWQPDDGWRSMEGLTSTWTEYDKWLLYALGYR